MWYNISMFPHARFKRFLRGASVVGLSVFISFFLFRLSTAGSLTPSAAPASTMNSVEEVYNSLVGTFDSSAVVASSQGNALQIAKCITSAMTGGPGCP